MSDNQKNKINLYAPLLCQRILEIQRLRAYFNSQSQQLLHKTLTKLNFTTEEMNIYDYNEYLKRTRLSFTKYKYEDYIESKIKRQRQIKQEIQRALQKNNKPASVENRPKNMRAKSLVNTLLIKLEDMERNVTINSPTTGKKRNKKKIVDFRHSFLTIPVERPKLLSNRHRRQSEMNFPTFITTLSEIPIHTQHIVSQQVKTFHYSKKMSTFRKHVKNISMSKELESDTAKLVKQEQQHRARSLSLRHQLQSLVQKHEKVKRQQGDFIQIIMGKRLRKNLMLFNKQIMRYKKKKTIEEIRRMIDCHKDYQFS